jgi:RecA/RadA recombinase
MPRPKKVKTPVEAEAVKPATVPTPPAAKRFPATYGFNYLDEAAAITGDVQKIVHGMAARRKNRTTSFKAMSDVRKNMIHIPDLPLQYLFGNYGIPERALIEIIGGEGVGKSSLCHYLEGRFLLQGCPVYHQECEGKPINAERVRRIVSEDPETGRKIVSAIHFDSARSLKESFEKLVDWIKIMRGKADGKKVSIPLHVPLLAVIDPWGKLMSKNEAAGFYDYGALKTEVAKDLLDVSNMGHSQGAHRWVRRLPYIMDTYNVTLILVQHQNQKVDMGGGGSSFIPEEARKLNNTTKTGGEAFNQLDALQFVIAKRGALKNSKGDPIGNTMKVKVSKNSYGPEGRIIEYDLVSDGFQDSGGKLDRAVRFDRWFSEFCAAKSFMGTSVNAKRYTCSSLGLTGARTDEFYDKFMATDTAVDSFGKAHSINGYDDVVGEAKAALSGFVQPDEHLPEDVPDPEEQPADEDQAFSWD